MNYPRISGEEDWYEYLQKKVRLNTTRINIYPYRYATIQQQMFNPEEVKPSAKYVLKEHLKIIKDLHKELLKKKINIFNLSGIVEIEPELFICPPILEVWNIPPWNGVPVIVDGLHRFYIAREKRWRIKCTVISGYISHVLPILPINWKDVNVFDEVPKDKRDYNPNIPHEFDYQELYRTPFPGSKGIRKKGTN